jgi:hypothetical protein
VFGCDVNSKGFKKPRGCGVIQGDGINITTLAQIVDAVTDAGYSAEVRLSMCEGCSPWLAASGAVMSQTAVFGTFLLVSDSGNRLRCMPPLRVCRHPDMPAVQ